MPNAKAQTVPTESTLLDQILEPGGLSVVFQPIFEVGGVEVEPDDNTVWSKEFKFADYPDLVQFNGAMAFWLQDTLGFDVIWESPYIDVFSANGFRRIRYYSSDEKVFKSHIALMSFIVPEFDPPF